MPSREYNVVNDAVMIACKAQPHWLTNKALAQVITYLPATGFQVDQLSSFGGVPAGLPPRSAGRLGEK